jgi:hypothetical protein
MNARDLLAAATPRPWATTENDNRFGSVASTNPAAIAAFCARWPKHGPEDVEAYGGALVGESIQAADRALIVAAVNEYEALLAVEAHLRSLFKGWHADAKSQQLLAALDEVRGV